MHEFAEQIGLGHRNEGTRGHDRRMILKKERIISDPVEATVAVLANEPLAAVGSDDFFSPRNRTST